MRNNTNSVGVLGILWDSVLSGQPLEISETGMVEAMCDLYDARDWETKEKVCREAAAVIRVALVVCASRGVTLPDLLGAVLSAAANNQQSVQVK